MHWDGISADAIMLIKGMLEKNPVKRMTALEALNSIWINTTCSELPLQNEVLENLKNFHVDQFRFSLKTSLRLWC